MSEPVLCVIDMQKPYTALQQILPAVMVRIDDFIKRDRHIFLVEYLGSGPSSQCICDALKHYDNVSYVSKPGRDGSCCIMEIAEYKKISMKSVHVCGVNTCECVKDTLIGLIRCVKDIDIHVAKNEVACPCAEDTKYLSCYYDIMDEMQFAIERSHEIR